MPKTSAQILANMRYREKAYDQIAIVVPKGEKAVFKKAADSFNLSISRLINLAVKEYIRNHSQTND